MASRAGSLGASLTLTTVLSLVASGTLLPTLAAHRITGHARGTGARVLASWPEEPLRALCRARGTRRGWVEQPWAPPPRHAHLPGTACPGSRPCRSSCHLSGHRTACGTVRRGTPRNSPARRPREGRLHRTAMRGLPAAPALPPAGVKLKGPCGCAPWGYVLGIRAPLGAPRLMPRGWSCCVHFTDEPQGLCGVEARAPGPPLPWGGGGSPPPTLLCRRSGERPCLFCLASARSLPACGPRGRVTSPVLGDLPLLCLCPPTSLGRGWGYHRLGTAQLQQRTLLGFHRSGTDPGPHGLAGSVWLGTGQGLPPPHSGQLRHRRGSRTHQGGRSDHRAPGHRGRPRRGGDIGPGWHSGISCDSVCRRSPWGSLRVGAP